MTEYIKKIPDKSYTPPFFSEGIWKNRKEKHFDSSLIVVAVNKHGAIQTLVDTRFYITDARVYCCIWVKLPHVILKGGDYAGGYICNRTSASLEYALNNANIEVNGLEGKGEEENCLLELGQKLNDKFNMGLTSLTVIKAHG